MAVTKTLVQKTTPDKVEAVRKAGQVYVDKGNDLADRLAGFILRSADVDGWWGKAQTAAGHRADELAGHARAIGAKFQDVGKAQITGADALDKPLENARDLISNAESSGRRHPFRVNEDLTVDDPNRGAFQRDVESVGWPPERVAKMLAERDQAREQIQAKLQENARIAEEAINTCAKAMTEGIQLALDEAPVLAALNKAQAEQDAQDVKDGKPLSPQEQARLAAATSLSKEQQDALAEGKEVALSPQQMQYIRALNRALDGKTPSEIKALADKLGMGDNGPKALANAMQLASDKQVTSTLPKVGPDGKPGKYEPTRGGYEQLPSKVRESIAQARAKSTVPTGPTGQPGQELITVDHGQDLKDLCSVLKHGDAYAQQGTELDRALLSKGAEIAHHVGADTKDSEYTRNTRDADQVAEAIFGTTAPDHQAVHDALQGDQGKQLLGDLTHHKWEDGGNGAGALLNQGQLADAGGHQGQLAGESEKVVAQYMAEHHDELAKLGGHGLAQTNPGLVQGVAQGLAPYVGDLSDSPLGKSGHHEGFGGPLDTKSNIASDVFPEAAKVFSILDGDDKAGQTINAAAYKHELQLLDAMAESEKNGNHDNRTYLDAVEHLRGITDKGIVDGVNASYANDDEKAKHSHDIKSVAYDTVKSLADTAAKETPLAPVLGPAMGALSPAFKQWLVGDSPDPRHPLPAPVENMENYSGMVANALLQAHPEIAQNSPFVKPDGTVMTYDEWAKVPGRTSYSHDTYMGEVRDLLKRLDPTIEQSIDGSANAYGKTASGGLPAPVK